MSLVMEWIERTGVGQLLLWVGAGGVAFIAATGLVFVAELGAGRNNARFRSRAFANDVVYTVFYRAGIYQVFLWAVIVNVFEEQLSSLRLNWFAEAPAAVSLAVYWIIGDLVLYWVHRAQHAIPVLWTFHSVHHAEHELNTLSQHRRHPVEKVMMGLSLYVPFVFVLGIPTSLWLPIFFVTQVLQALQHAELDWRLGPLYRILVSPVFHSVHHSTDRGDYDSNYGSMFSAWDYLFGTAASRNTRPERYGVDGIDMKESILSQLIEPFVMIFNLPRKSVVAKESSKESA